ncbi:RNA-binding protein Musashi homolog [Seminavis robusta]|uniref:RNA-binding protein Musashi homolog n=1 Tax=Seminavis robusta TaxID=568900 RepID=A0A9N8H6T8_9STRA|nr:RNA-binding protein Musashi homolog [Seminavis robusta]|eukprot:Sro110_g054740.1 RNA-binding protein Musashi homolog (399) ;mRNA; r:7365-8739
MTTNSSNNPTVTIPPVQPQPQQQQSQQHLQQQPIRKTNDNSNPQQGTELGGGGATQTAPTESANPVTPMRPQNNNGTVDGRTNMMKSPPTKKDSRKLFVGGLPADVVEGEFREFFEQFGEVVDSVVMFDRETRRSRGFGFVTFRDPEVAERLLNTRQDDEATGGALAAEMANGQRVGRLVMRGKTCEVKAAEPKEASRSARRGYQNQGFGGGTPNRRYDKPFTSPGGVGGQGGAPHHVPMGAHPSVAAYHDPHYMVGHHHHYPMMAPPYYPAYHHHPGMYNGAGYHQPAPSLYAPMTAPVHDGHHPVVQQPIVPPAGVDAHLEGPAGPFVEPHQDAHHLAYGQQPHEGMMHPPYPGQQGAHMNPKFDPYYTGVPYAPPGTSSSAMHPAAPGIPPKDDK